MKPMPPWSWIPVAYTLRYASEAYAFAMDTASGASGTFSSTAHAA